MTDTAEKAIVSSMKLGWVSGIRTPSGSQVSPPGGPRPGWSR